MSTCEFKAECEIPCLREPQQALIERCVFRKFAILVVNRTVEKAMHAVLSVMEDDLIIPTQATDVNSYLEALKMEED